MRQATKSGNAPKNPSEKTQVIKPDHVTRGQRLLVDPITGKMCLAGSLAVISP